MSFILSLFSFLLVSLFCLNISMFYYALIFIALVVTFLGVIFLSNMVRSVFSILFMIVYIGAIIVILAYVCSVLPNEKMYSLNFYLLTTFLIVCSLITYTSFLPSINYSRGSQYSLDSLSSFFYVSRFGVFIILMFLLLILLLIATNSFNLKSTLRRLCVISKNSSFSKNC
jgi:hypothetical protein